MSAVDTYKIWSTDPFFDETTRNELLAIADNSTEIEDRFYKDLEFGTGGLRGIIGAGTNRINAYTVAKASAGLADSVWGGKPAHTPKAVFFRSWHPLSLQYMSIIRPQKTI